MTSRLRDRAPDATGTEPHVPRSHQSRANTVDGGSPLLRRRPRPAQAYTSTMDSETPMKAAIAEAELARGTTGDNPWVGSVVVVGDAVVARGHTQGPGEDHAEIGALREAREGSRIPLGPRSTRRSNRARFTDEPPRVRRSSRRAVFAASSPAFATQTRASTGWV